MICISLRQLEQENRKYVNCGKADVRHSWNAYNCGNNLVKKGYVSRVRSEEDRRVVLIFLTEKGKRAYQHHREFHDGMVKALVEGLDEGQQKILVKSLLNLRTFFDSYKKD